ncbi:MAG: creatininase family protein [Candidatus Thermoplasmatota archaeon]|nr:creatininase family protein [Candidatus Thermoplasmatota archaeon]
MRYAEMTWPAIEALDRDTLLLLTVSPMEEHGPHLPVGTDLFVAQAVEDRVMTSLGENHPVVALPPLPLGTCRMAADFPGSLSLPWKVVRDVVGHTLESLAEQGFTRVMLLTFHMDLHHVKALQAAMARVRGSGLTACEPLSAHYFRGNLLPPVDGEAEVHADLRETSLALALFPELVHGHEHLPPVHARLDGPSALFRTMRELGAERGYVGDPSRASREYGQRCLEQVIQVCVQAARALLTGEEIPRLPSRIRLLLRLI